MGQRAETDIAVIGAGVIGLACALRLAHEGVEVLLIDRGEPGAGCSYGNAAHIATELVFPLASPQTLRDLPKILFDANAPLRIDPAYALRAAPWFLRFAASATPARYKAGVSALAAIQSIAADEMRSLLQAAHAEDCLHMDGHLMLVANEQSRPRIDRMRREEEALGVRSEWKTPEDVAALAPDVTRAVTGAVYYRDTGHVANPYTVCRKLFDAFTQAGGAFLKTQIDRIDASGSSGFMLHGVNSAVRAKRVVVAAGAW
ncbi:MAG: NAD(P)/FAD-dependent oxidoreductase, partial [Hyphococcus sp.]